MVEWLSRMNLWHKLSYITWRGPKQPTSNGCKMWLVCAGRMNRTMFLSWAHSTKPIEMWDLWPSIIRITGLPSSTGTNWRKWSLKNWRKIAEFDHPLSLTVPTAPGAAPWSSSGNILLPANTKKGGSDIPAALPHPRTVVVVDFPDVTAWGTESPAATMEGGVWFCENPFSSTLKILCGLLVRSYFCNIFWSSSK